MRRLLLALLALSPVSALAAFHAGTAWEVRTTATDANGGGGFRNVSNLAAPSAPSLSCPTTGGTVAANTYYVVVNYVDAYGNEGPASAASICTTTGSTSSIVTTSPAASSRAVNYRVYMSATNLPGPWWANPGTDVAIGTNSTRTTTPATSGTQPVGQSDYSQQNSVQTAYTDIVIGGTTTTATSVAVPFLPAMVGNVINVTAGAGCTVQRAQITAVSAANVATFDKSLGTGASTCTGGLGGALQSLTAAALLTVAGNTVFVASGTYSETLTLSVSGGNGLPITWRGYSASHMDIPTTAQRPVIDAASTRANCISFPSGLAHYLLDGFVLTGGTSDNFTTATSGPLVVRRVKSTGSAANGFYYLGTSELTLIEIESASNTGCGVRIQTNGGAPTVVIYGAYIHDNTSNGVGFNLSSNVSTYGGVFNSIVESNAASNVRLGHGTNIYGSTIYGATGGSSDGVEMAIANAAHAVVANSILASNGRYGISRASAAGSCAVLSWNNALHGNATAAYLNVAVDAADVTSDPGFTDGPNGNFAIGTNLKALGFPGAFPGGLSTSYTDIGAVQRQEPSAGGGLLILGGSVVK